jgi:hypothetical protein
MKNSDELIAYPKPCVNRVFKTKGFKMVTNDKGSGGYHFPYRLFQSQTSCSYEVQEGLQVSSETWRFS